jgi:hypothetical protein
MSYSWNAPGRSSIDSVHRRLCYRSGLGKEIKLTFEFLIQPPSAGHAQCAYKLLEVDGTITILIKDVEDVVGELSRITEWEELLVYPTKFSFVELTWWTIL